MKALTQPVRHSSKSDGGRTQGGQFRPHRRVTQIKTLNLGECAVSIKAVFFTTRHGDTGETVCHSGQSETRTRNPA